MFPIRLSKNTYTQLKKLGGASELTVKLSYLATHFLLTLLCSHSGAGNQGLQLHTTKKKHLHNTLQKTLA
jgi:hypothetical protein